ncbi:Holliday junction resolvase RuvX, partial [Klebsiella pneumoniae]
RNFANKIHGRFGVAILLHDERLSTVEARAGLFGRLSSRAPNSGL